MSRPTALALLLFTLWSPALVAQDAPASQRPARLLVIAPDPFQDALSEFVTFKQDSLPTQLVSLQEILRTSPGCDDPERLKRYLFTRWRAGDVGYVLLVGDVDVMPVRYMVLDRVTPAAFDYAFYPSDLYYADLAKPDGSFDDWNARQDSFHGQYFGEVRGEKNKEDGINYDQVDYRCDVAVGRWPVSNVQEVKLVAAKTMAYERAVRAGQKPGRNRAALVVISGWVDARRQLAGMLESLQDDWQLDQRIYSDWRRRYDTPPPTESEVLKLLNEGVGLMIHAGHGTDDRWEKNISLRSLPRLSNADRLPVMISAGCSTATCAALGPYQAYVDVKGVAHQGTDHGEVFAAPPAPPAPYQTGPYNRTGLGEQLLRGQPAGAVAYIGCNTGSQPCALTLVEGFTRSLALQPTRRLGDCWCDAIAYYYEHERLAELQPTSSWYPASVFFQGMKFMVLGDPTLPLQ